METVGVALGTVSLFFQVYDACRRLYDGYENLRHFGKDMGLLLARIQIIEFDLDTLMMTKTNDLLKPPDVLDENHPVTKQVLRHLKVIRTHFKNCKKIIARTLRTPQTVVLGHGMGPGILTTALENSPRMFTEDDGTISILNTEKAPITPPLVSPYASKSPVSNAVTPTKPKHKHSWLNKFLRMKLSGKSSEHSGANCASPTPTQSNPSTVIPSELAATGWDNGNPKAQRIGLEDPLSAGFSIQDAASRKVRAEARMWILVKWTDHNKDLLEKEIDRLRDSERDFRQSLELREPHDLQRALDLATPSAPTSCVSKLPPMAVLDVHEALKSIQNPSATSASFSLSIAKSCESNRRALADFPGMKNSLLLQGHL